MTWFLGKDLNPKKVGEGGQSETTCGFSKNVLSREKVKPCCFVTFDNSLFSENLIEIPHVDHKM